MDARFFHDTRPDSTPAADPNVTDRAGILFDIKLTPDGAFTATVNHQAIWIDMGPNRCGAKRTDQGNYELDGNKIIFTLGGSQSSFAQCNCTANCCTCFDTMQPVSVPPEWQRFTTELKDGKLCGYPKCGGSTKFAANNDVEIPMKAATKAPSRLSLLLQETKRLEEGA